MLSQGNGSLPLARLWRSLRPTEQGMRPSTERGMRPVLLRQAPRVSAHLGLLAILGFLAIHAAEGRKLSRPSRAFAHPRGRRPNVDSPYWFILAIRRPKAERCSPAGGSSVDPEGILGA